eukprot:g780.t1
MVKGTSAEISIIAPRESFVASISSVEVLFKVKANNFKLHKENLMIVHIRILQDPLSPVLMDQLVDVDMSGKDEVAQQVVLFGLANADNYIAQVSLLSSSTKKKEFLSFASVHFAVSAIPPSFKVISPRQDEILDSSTVQLHLAHTQPSCRNCLLNLTLDQGIPLQLKSDTQIANITSLRNGQHEIKLQILDPYGNALVNSPSREHSFIIRAPEVSLHLLEPKMEQQFRKDEKIVIILDIDGNFKVGEDGYIHLNIVVLQDGVVKHEKESYYDSPKPIIIEGLDHGSYHLTVAVVDKLGFSIPDKDNPEKYALQSVHVNVAPGSRAQKQPFPSPSKDPIIENGGNTNYDRTEKIYLKLTCEGQGKAVLVLDTSAKVDDLIKKIYSTEIFEGQITMIEDSEGYRIHPNLILNDIAMGENELHLAVIMA